MKSKKLDIFLKREYIKKDFLKQEVNKESFKAQRKRLASIELAIIDALTKKPKLHKDELIKIAKHIDRRVNSDWVRKQGREKHHNRYKTSHPNFKNSANEFGINPIDYAVANKTIINNSHPFSEGAYRYIVKSLLKELEEE